MVSVRPATPPEGPVLASIQLACWSQVYGEAYPGLVAALDAGQVARAWAEACVHAMGGSPYGVFVAAPDAEAPACGFVAFGPCLDPDAGAGVAELAGLYVLPEAQRQGHGSRLLAAVAGSAPGKGGATRLTAWVWAADYIRQRFLKQVGFDADGATRTWRTPEGDLVDEARWSTLLPAGD